MGITTEILTDGDPLDAILSAVEKAYKPISSTMGPLGKYVLYKQFGVGVGTTNDGVTVAKLVRSNNEAEDAVIDYIREGALKLDDTTGDSTTTVFVLTREILVGAIAAIKKGENPTRLRLALEALEPEIIQQIIDATDNDLTLEKLTDIANTSAKDKEIGGAVAKTVWEAGIDTPILLSFSDSTDTFAEVIDGFKINTGPASPYFMREGVATELIDPYIIVVDAKLRDKEDILPMLRISAQMPETERKLLFVVSDIAGDALQFLIANHAKGFGQIACAIVPQTIHSHTDYLSDLALTCGAKLISRNGSHTIKDVTVNDFGRAQKVTVQPSETVIISGQRIQEDFDAQIEALEDMRKNHKTKAGRKFADDRLKMLQQKIISIYVGGQNSKDAEKRHYAYEDALGASKAALRGGIVPGGGTLLYEIGNSMDKSKAGVILSKALQAPIIKILDNAGFDYKKKWYETKGKLNFVSAGFGYDATQLNGGIIDLTKRGIIDPAQSEIESVRTAINIAGNLITNGALIVERKTNEQTEQPFSVN